MLMVYLGRETSSFIVTAKMLGLRLRIYHVRAVHTAGECIPSGNLLRKILMMWFHQLLGHITLLITQLMALIVRLENVILLLGQG